MFIGGFNATNELINLPLKTHKEPQGCLFFWGCPLSSIVHDGKVSVIRRCPLFGCSYYWDVSVIGRCTLLGRRCLSSGGTRPLLDSVRYKKISVIWILVF